MLLGSTADAEISLFQALSAGKIIMPKISEELPVQFVPGIVVTGFVESLIGCFSGDGVFFEQEANYSKNTIVK